MKREIGIEERPPLLKMIPLSLQHLFAMFGATVLVPFLLKMDVSTILFFNGVGTIIYIFVCKKQIPAYLGSSFAFIAPTLLIISEYGTHSAALGGFIAVGFILCIASLLIKKFGTEWIYAIFPNASMGAIVAVIGLELAPTAGTMSGLNFAAEGFSLPHAGIALVTFLVASLGTVLFKGFLSIIPILVALIVGYLFAICLGIVDFSGISNAPWFGSPTIIYPTFHINAILTLIPVALVVIVENIGHLAVTGNIVRRDLIKQPGVHRSLLGNGLSTILSGFFGSTPNTTYGENIGVLAISRVFSVYVILGAACFAILLSFSGKLAAIIQTIPTPVMGGICLLLFGVIALSGVRMLVDGRVDYDKPMNLVLTSSILAIGLSGIEVNFFGIALKGMTLATLVGAVLGILFYLLSKKQKYS